MLSRNSVFSQMYYQPAGPDCQNPHKMGTVVNWKGLATVRAAPPEYPFRHGLSASFGGGFRFGNGSQWIQASGLGLGGTGKERVFSVKPMDMLELV